jgi:putative salt-induced outer membrane protein
MTLAGLFLIVTASTVSGAEEEPKFWSGDVEVGAVFTSGNTEQETLKLRFDTKRETDGSIHLVHGDTFRASQDGDDSANRLYLFYRYDYKLDTDRSLFARLAYEEDEFSGFDSQIDLTAGYNQMLFRRDRLTIEGDIGLGMRYVELDTGASGSEGLVRLAAALKWQVSENALFTQLLGFEIGKELTTTRSVTALESTIVGNLAMKLAISIKNNSEVLPGKDKTDTESTVTVVYKF